MIYFSLQRIHPMPSLEDRKRVYENYFAAINEHNVEKALSFYEDDLENKQKSLFRY